MKKSSKRKNKSNKKLILLMVLVLFVGIGFAALQSNLRINGNASIESTFSVGIIDISMSETNGSAYEVSSPTHTTTTATFNVGLMIPGDSMTYDIKVSNDGNLNAKLDSLILDQTGNPNIKYEIVNIEEGYILPSYNQKIFQVKVSYLDTEVADEMPYKEATISMSFVQTSENTTEQDEVVELIKNSKTSWYGEVSDRYFSADNDGIKISNVGGIVGYGDGYVSIYDLNDNLIMSADEWDSEMVLNYNQEYSFYAIGSDVINGQKVYAQKSDASQFYLVLDDDGFVRNYKTITGSSCDIIAYSKDATNTSVTLPLSDYVTGFAPALFQENQYLETIVIPSGFDTSKLSRGMFRSVTGSIKKIVNLTGETINWTPLIGETTESCEFETGTCTVYGSDIVITNQE